MKISFGKCLGLAFALAVAGSNCQAAIFLFDGSVDNAFLTANNWSDATPPPVPPVVTPVAAVPGAADRAIINNSFVVTYGTSDSTSVASLIVGADWPVTGDVGTPGTLNMSDGKLIVSGGGDNFQIGRACCAGDGAMNMTGDAELEIGGSDPVVGTRDNGVLDVGGTASVHSTAPIESYWRLGNYGPSTDAGLQGNGLLNVHDSGSFRAHVIFIGDNDASGELRVADNGSVILTGNLVPRPSGFQALGQAKVQMSGSNATLNAFNLESESLAGEMPTQYLFTADAGGVSEIKLSDAVNITNNALSVDLTSYPLALGSSLLLFDAAPTRVFGTFASLSVTGVANPGDYHVIYDNPNGDILLTHVPEPATLVLLGMGLMLAVGVNRRTSRGGN